MTRLLDVVLREPEGPDGSQVVMTGTNPVVSANLQALFEQTAGHVTSDDLKRVGLTSSDDHPTRTLEILAAGHVVSVIQLR